MSAVPHRPSLKHIALLCLLLLFAASNSLLAADALYDGFRNPPSSARPDVYWWWNGNAATDGEISRELNVLHTAGIGGVLIFPMARTMGAKKTSARELEWLSPEWGRAIHTAVTEAGRLGMSVDLLVGSGWPFGGPFLQSGEKLQRVKVAKRVLTGPSTFRGKISDLMVLPGGAYGETDNGSAPKLLFLRLVPNDSRELTAGLDLTSRAKSDGSVEFDVPAGEHTLCTGALKEGFMIVNIPGPGGQGAVLDHFSKPATDHYLKEFESKLKPAFGGSLAGLRSLHCDSFEFTGANWTGDLPAEFEKRRGYSLTPYLQYALDDTDPTGPPEFVDRVWRLRSDLWYTMEQLFEERFLTTFHNWARENGCDSRVEAYGCPAMDHLDPMLVADRPMCETWISVERNIPSDETLIPLEATRGADRMCLWGTMSNKYTSSAAHLMGRSEVSCETMTNDMSAFRTTLEQIKLACDLNYVTGVNHPVFHGYNLNPPDAGFPGWFYCGEYFDEKNTWWPYFRHLTDYCGRLSWVLQTSDPQAEVALIDPAHNCWEPLHQNGFSADYVSESILREAALGGGRIRYRKKTYDVLVVANCWSMTPETAKAIVRFVSGGGKVLFVGEAPGRCPGLKDFGAKDAEVKSMMERVVRTKDRVALIPKRAPGTPITWIRDGLVSLGIQPPVEISSPDPLLYQIHQKSQGRDVFFFANLNCGKSVSFRGVFRTGPSIPWRWDPETGQRNVFQYGATPNALDIRLKPKESMLLVFEPSMSGRPAWEPEPDMDDSLPLNRHWQVEFRPAQGGPYTRFLGRLMDLSQDPQLSSFSGTAVYRTEFNASDLGHRLLSLGQVCDISEVSLNGKPFGVRWWGDHVYDVGRALQLGRNSLEIRVTTTLSNYCRSLKDNEVARIWTTDKGRAVLPSGLIGPVRLCRVRR